MKKRLIGRALFGVPLGITIGYVISIITSVIWANGYYSPCVPGFTEMVGSEIGAVILQTVLCGIIGAGFAMATVIWEMERWSIAKQSGTYFVVVAAVMLPIAYLAQWMKHSLTGFLSYLGVFIVIYLIVWLAEYWFWRIKIKQMNQKVRNQSSSL